MAYEMRELSGSLFINEKKEKETHPDVQGTCLIEGKRFYMSGWKKQTSQGVEWTSLSFKSAETLAPKVEAAPEIVDDGDTIPF